MTWHLLQVSDVLDIEFGAALAERVPLMAWEPERVRLPTLRSVGTSREVSDPPLKIERFPLMRGFARRPWSAIAFTGKTLTRQLLQRTGDPANSPLLCTIPYFAPVAELWPGPVIYWLTDRMERYDGANAAAVHRLDKRMCRAASLVCPNSSRLAEYLIQHGDCPPDKIVVLPNATRAANLLPAAPVAAGPLPSDIASLPRPVAGIIGNLAGNMDWFFLEELIHRTPGMHWAFVGPSSMAIGDPLQSMARERVMGLSTTRFIGRKPYGDLVHYARAFDVAVLPYRRCEPTYSGSSTRFYEHLAACRPMLATHGFEELLRKEPLLRLVETAAEGASFLKTLAANNFKDGHEVRRWLESQQGTWQARAETLIEALNELPARACVSVASAQRQANAVSSRR